MYRNLALGALVIYATFVWWFIGALDAAGQSIANSWREISKPAPVPAAIIRFDNAPKGLVVPSWSWLESDRIWGYVSRTAAIDINYQPKLADLTVAHGQWIDDSRARPEAVAALEKLFAAAKQQSQSLIVTSAYRNVEHHRQLLADSIASYGEAWAAAYMPPEGHSEHQLGLAIDISTYTPACEQDFANCAITQSTTDWLATNAPQFGFILRYPPGKSHITGINYEPWHFRYVGEDMAKLVQDSGLTFDEVFAELDQIK